MDIDITAIFIVATVFYFTFRIADLFVRRKERINLIEKLSEQSLPSGILDKLNIGLNLKESPNKSFWPLRISLLFIGVGIGLIVGFLIDMSYSGYIMGDTWVVRNKISMIYSACVFVFGGIGLLIAFLIEKRDNKLEKQ